MRNLMKQVWWVLLLGGIASVIFGLLAFAWPGLTILLLALFFAASVFVDGVFNVIGAFRNRNQRHWWYVLVLGIVGVVAGGYALMQPEAAAIALLIIVSAYAAISGITLIAVGWKLRDEIEGEWLLIATGALSLLFGIMLIALPAVGLLSLVWLVAVWAVVTGVLRIMFALRARRFAERMAPAA